MAKKKKKVLTIIMSATILGTIVLIIIVKLIMGAIYGTRSKTTNSKSAPTSTVPKISSPTAKPRPVKVIANPEFEGKYKALNSKLFKLNKASRGQKPAVIKASLKKSIILLEAFLKENDTDKYRNLPHYKKVEETLEAQKSTLEMY